MKIAISWLLGLITTGVTAQVHFRNVTVVDVEQKKLLPGQQVLVQNGIISYTGERLPVGMKPDTVIDGAGKYLLPGWIDAHVHFFQSGGLYTRPDGIDLRKFRSYARETEWTHAQMGNLLQRYLAAGITTVVDLGATVNFLKQRDSFQIKTNVAAVYMTGPLLTTYEPPVYKGLGDDEPFYEMKTPEDARRCVERQLPYHPDFIKIWYIASGRDKDNAARTCLPVVQQAIATAHQHGLRVAVHATELLTARLAVEAGAEYLVHCIENGSVDSSFLQLLRRKKVVLCPTLVVSDNYHKVYAGDYSPSAEDRRYAHPVPLGSLEELTHLPDTAVAIRYKSLTVQRRPLYHYMDSVRIDNFRRLYRGGVTIAAGTDAGNIGTQHAGSYFDELRAMHRAGMDMWQLLQAATINGAKALGKENSLGSIAKGKTADLLLLGNNPLEGLDAWQSVECVLHRGIVWQPRLLLQPGPEELVQEQFNAYNAHDLEAFLVPYADDVEVYDFPGTMRLKGKEAMRKAYQFVGSTPALHCRLLNRMVQQNKVIDHEEVTGKNGKKQAIAVYETYGGKITKVYFIR